MTKVLCCGSRTWTDRKIIHEALKHLAEEDLIIHGGNGRYDKERKLYVGADLLCQQMALVHSIPQVSYPVPEAEWKKYGLAAGPRRNQRMYDTEQPDAVIAFRMPGVSKGTDGMVKIALAGGTSVNAYLLSGSGVLTVVTPMNDEEYRDLLWRHEIIS